MVALERGCTALGRQNEKPATTPPRRVGLKSPPVYRSRRIRLPPLENNVNLIQDGSFLTLHYRLSGPDGGDLVNTFADKPATLSLGSGQLSPAIEQRLIGLAEGSHSKFELAPGEAFGERNQELVQRVKRSLMQSLGDPDEDYQVGDVVQFPTPDGQGSYAGLVREVADDWLLFDFNHPLAGQAVSFEVQVIGVL